MAFTFGTSGLISSWGSGTDFTNRLVSSYNSPVSTTINLIADSHDATRFTSDTGGAIPARNIKGLRSISGSFKAFVSGTTPRIGSTGLLTYGTYGGFCNAYDLNLKAAFADTTIFNATAPEWKAFTPGLISWDFSADAFVDNATALPGAGLDAEPASVTFQVGSAKSLSGSAITTSVQFETDPTKVQTVKFSAVGDSYLSVAGATGELFAVDPGGGVYTLTTPVLNTMTVVSAGTTYSGSAFWTSINLKVAVGSPIEITVNWQGSGAWTGFTGV
jgi:hypothetical protein